MTTPEGSTEVTDPVPARRVRRSLLVLAIAVVAASVVVLSDVTDRAEVTPNVFDTGEVALSTTPTTAVVDMADMGPGDAVAAPLRVRNRGTLDLQYAVTSTTGDDPLARALRLDITAMPRRERCREETDSGGQVLHEGVLGNESGVAVVGDPAWREHPGNRPLAADEHELLCFRVRLPPDVADPESPESSEDSESLETATTSATFRFDASYPAAGDEAGGDPAEELPD